MLVVNLLDGTSVSTEYKLVRLKAKHENLNDALVKDIAWMRLGRI